ncbi:MAG: hypothetical protein U0835_15195 [Isosphaeraceae bacterium]
MNTRTTLWPLLAALLMTQTPAAAEDAAYRARGRGLAPGRGGEAEGRRRLADLAGLFWVKPGATTLGSDPSCDLVLPASAPPRIGTLRLAEDGTASLEAPEGVSLTPRRRGVPRRAGAVRRGREKGG